MGLPTPTRRHFTDAARAAAAAARKRRREAAIPKDAPEVFVVRLPGAHLRFRWEIRRFGAVVLDRSVPDYPTIQAARSGGEAALAGQSVKA